MVTTLQFSTDFVRDLNLIAEDKKLFSELKLFVKKLLAKKPQTTVTALQEEVSDDLEDNVLCSMDRAIEDIKSGNVYTASSVEDLIKQCKDEVYA